MIKGFSINKRCQYSSIQNNKSVSKSKDKQNMMQNKKTFVVNKIIVPSQKKVNASGGYFDK